MTTYYMQPVDSNINLAVDGKHDWLKQHAARFISAPWRVATAQPVVWASKTFNAPRNRVGLPVLHDHAMWKLNSSALETAVHYLCWVAMDGKAHRWAACRLIVVSNITIYITWLDTLLCLFFKKKIPELNSWLLQLGVTSVGSEKGKQ